MPKSGDVVITRVQFADGEDSKIRPALVLFEELGNIVIAGITTNLQMKGIRISTNEGAAQYSVIKLNYIFTITDGTIIKTIFQLSPEKKRLVFEEFVKKLGSLKD
jgi:mRNA interferase MazF